ncbi:MAG TPA: amidohydrolase family protein [Reyranella sp.]|jgi:predicted TIM-barrel fold metal-dependent hydrolase
MANDTSLGGLFGGNTKPTQFGRIFKPDPAWHAKAEPEPILEPELPIVDTHHHIWDMPGYRYLLHDLLADLNTGHNIVATVFNECHAMYRARGPQEMKPVGEVEFCAGVAAMSDSGLYGPARICAGVVGHADLTLGDRVAGVLEAEIAAGGGRFKGIRYGAAWDDDPIIGNSHVAKGPGVHRSAPFREGLQRLTKLGLSFDAWIFFHQVPEVTELARLYPDANIVLCHMGGVLGYGRHTGKKDEIFVQWKASMTELAKCPNVSVKIGGLMMRLGAIDYLHLDKPPTSQQLADAWRPYAGTCLELFGADRCMVESNFPVEKMGIGYAGLFNALKRIAAGASAGEKKVLFSGTAKRVYRLAIDE